MGIIVAQFICSLGNRPQGSSRIYTGSAILFSIIMLFLLAMSFMLIANSWPQSGTGTDWLVNGGTGRDVVLATVSTFGVYAAASLMAGEFVQVMSCLVQYLLMLPFFINTLAIYVYRRAGYGVSCHVTVFLPHRPSAIAMMYHGAPKVTTTSRQHQIAAKHGRLSS